MRGGAAALAGALRRAAEAAGADIRTGTAVREILAGRLGEPMEIGAAVSFLASAGAGFVTGQTLCVDGGRSDRM